MTPLLSTAILRTQSDRRLVALAQAGHEVAFTTIVERYRPQLRRYCTRLVPEGRVDDALQQAFLDAWRALQNGRAVRELRPWLYAVVHNAAVTQLRTGVLDYVELLDTLEGAGGTEVDVERRSVLRQTLAAVANLPDRQRAALLAVALDGRPQSEVAVAMGLTDNGLRQLLFRARTAVRGAATAITPIPVLAWGLRAAGAGAVAGGGAAALPAGTALVVAGTLAVGGAVGLRTPAPAQRTPSTPLVAETPTAGPVAARTARAALGRTGLRVVRARLVGAAAPRASTTRPAAIVALRGSHGVRVIAQAAPRSTAHAPDVTPQFVSTTAPAAATAPAPAIAAPQPVAAAAEAQPAAPAAETAPAAEAPAAPAAEAPAMPRAKPEGDDDGRDSDEGDRDRQDDEED